MELGLVMVLAQMYLNSGCVVYTHLHKFLEADLIFSITLVRYTEWITIRTPAQCNLTSVTWYVSSAVDGNFVQERFIYLPSCQSCFNGLHAYVAIINFRVQCQMIFARFKWEDYYLVLNIQHLAWIISGYLIKCVYHTVFVSCIFLI